MDQAGELLGAQRDVMRSRLRAMTQPKPGDNAKTAALRARLRDERVMAQVVANVEQWPALTDDQCQTIAALVAERGRYALAA